MVRLFGLIAPASGLHLNLATTVLISLWTWQRANAAECWQRVVRTWSAVRAAYSRRRLDFEIGPVAAESSSGVPVRKFKEAVVQWAEHTPGTCFALWAHRAYAVSKLQYSAKLKSSSPRWAGLEWWAVQRLFPGTSDWLPPGVAQSPRGLVWDADPVAVCRLSGARRPTPCHPRGWRPPL